MKRVTRTDTTSPLRVHFIHFVQQTNEKPADI
jgi:hypothetical protein